MRVRIGDRYDGGDERYYVEYQERDGTMAWDDPLYHYDRAEGEQVVATYNARSHDVTAALRPVSPAELAPMAWQVERIDGGWGLVYRNEARRLWTRGGVYQTRVEAKLALMDYLYIDQHINDLPDELTRDEYERRAAIAGVETLEDGIHYFGVYNYPEYRPMQVVMYRLAQRRMHTWTTEQAAAQARRAAALPARPEETFICAGCGMEYPRSMAMNASLGISCPDCYDDLAG